MGQVRGGQRKAGLHPLQAAIKDDQDQAQVGESGSALCYLIEMGGDQEYPIDCWLQNGQNGDDHQLNDQARDICVRVGGFS